MLIRIAGLVPESYVDGAGIRFAVFMQGCFRNCHACHNPYTHPLYSGTACDTSDIVAQFKDNKLIKGITLTGGEPLLQIEAATELAKAAKDCGLDVWLYTGFTFENLPTMTAPLLDFVDVLVDGDFQLCHADLDLQFCGSSNQRIIDVPISRLTGNVILWEDEHLAYNQQIPETQNQIVNVKNIVPPSKCPHE